MGDADFRIFRRLSRGHGRGFDPNNADDDPKSYSYLNTDSVRLPLLVLTALEGLTTGRKLPAGTRNGANLKSWLAPFQLPSPRALPKALRAGP